MSLHLYLYTKSFKTPFAVKLPEC